MAEQRMYHGDEEADLRRASTGTGELYPKIVEQRTVVEEPMPDPTDELETQGSVTEVWPDKAPKRDPAITVSLEAPASSTEAPDAPEDDLVPPKRRPGRPRGSRNKPRKPTVEKSAVVKQGRPSRAELAARAKVAAEAPRIPTGVELYGTDDPANPQKKPRGRKKRDPYELLAQAAFRAGKLACKEAEEIRWAKNNLLIPLKEVGAAPSPGAVAWLQYARNPDNWGEFFRLVSRLLPNRSQVETRERFEDDGSNIEHDADRILAQARKEGAS